MTSGGTDYASYLLIDDLLGLQRPITPEAHDEMLFIIVHQAYELWFKLILHETALAVTELRAGRPQAAARPLRRVVAIERVLEEQLGVLETMGPEGFLEFRDPLAPASGFQSRQFREIEADGPRLWSAFLACGRSLGLRLPEDDDDARLEELATLYRENRDDAGRAALRDVAELLVDHDEGILRWRIHHVLMAAREIGSRPGTGGSRGVDYLQSTITKRFFGDLWALRSVL